MNRFQKNSIKEDKKQGKEMKIELKFILEREGFLTQKKFRGGIKLLGEELKF